MKVLSPSSRRSSWLALVAIPIGLAACGSSQSSPPPQAPGTAIGGGPGTVLSPEMGAAAPLLNSVTSSVPGLSTSQAATGVGSLLALAQKKMPANQFAQVSKSVPSTDALIAGAHQQGVPSGNNLIGRSSLTNTFNSAGISPDQATQIGAVIAGDIAQSAGPTVAQSFMSAVK